jgi:hypothetical protein
MLCIDPARKIVLRDRTETRTPQDIVSVNTVTFERSD